MKHGPCPKCRPKGTGWKPDRVRGSRIARGYGEDWQKLRRAKLTADPLCEPCLAKTPEEVTAAQEVHHRIPFKGPADPLRLDWDNLVSTCKACHAVETGRRKRG